MRILLSFLSILLSISVNAQKINIIDFELQDNDTIFLSNLPEVAILEFKNKSERNIYYYLKRKVLKVYPYAIIAKNKIDEINFALDSIPKRRKKKLYKKEVTKWIKQEYADRLKNLTMNEGKILVKLIFRETNITPYEIVRSYRGSFNAFFWQVMARLWDNNLKTEYDPLTNREDMMIEHILMQAKLERDI